MKCACTLIEQEAQLTLFVQPLMKNGFSKLSFSATIQGSRLKEIEVPLLNQEEYLHCRNQLVHAIEVRAENWWLVEHFLPEEQGRFGRQISYRVTKNNSKLEVSEQVTSVSILFFRADITNLVLSIKQNNQHIVP